MHHTRGKFIYYATTDVPFLSLGGRGHFIIISWSGFGFGLLALSNGSSFVVLPSGACMLKYAIKAHHMMISSERGWLSYSYDVESGRGRTAVGHVLRNVAEPVRFSLVKACRRDALSAAYYSIAPILTVSSHGISMPLTRNRSRHHLIGQCSARVKVIHTSKFTATSSLLPCNL